jgi:hypothetical protein
MREAIRLGPVTRGLAYDAARLFALAGKQRPELQEETIRQLTSAVSLGHDPAALQRSQLFRELKDDRAFQKLLQSRPGKPEPDRELRLVDPLPDNEATTER